MTRVKASVAGLVAVLVAGCGGSPYDGAWFTEEGDEVPTGLLWVVQAPEEHCRWGSATFMFIGRDGELSGVPASFNHQFIRDPEGLFADNLSGPFEVLGSLPLTSIDTGYTNGAATLWLDPDDSSSVIVVLGDRIELWPRVTLDHPILCA